MFKVYKKLIATVFLDHDHVILFFFFLIYCLITELLPTLNLVRFDEKY